MRTIGVLLGCLAIIATATASTVVDVTVLPRPGFPGPAKNVSPKDRLALVSSRYRSPAELPPALPPPPASAPKRFRGADLQFAIRQPPRVFLVYVIKLRGDRLHVRTYDRQVVARINGP